MNTKIFRLACTVAFILGTIQQANATQITIDFEDVGLISTFGVTNLSSRGFTFTSARDPGLGTLINGNPCGPNCAANGTTTLTVSGFGAGVGSGGSNTQPLSLTNNKNQPFQLLGLDIAEFTDTLSYNADRIQLTGSILNGGTLVQVLFLDGVNDGPGNLADFETAVLDEFWSKSLLISLKFQGFRGSTPSFFNEGFILDNIRVNVIPEPLTCLGVGTALAFGTAFKRQLKQKQRNNLKI